MGRIAGGSEPGEGKCSLPRGSQWLPFPVLMKSAFCTGVWRRICIARSLYDCLFFAYWWYVLDNQLH